MNNMVELTIQDSYLRSRLLASGKKKDTYVVAAQETVVENDQAYKVVLKITGPDKEVAQELLGTVKLGEKIEAEFTPVLPE